MLATWPMVCAALGAGVVIGVLALGAPQEQESRNRSNPAAAAPAQSAASQPRTIEQTRKAALAANSKNASAAAERDEQSCERQEWPYRDAFCIDRTVKSPQAVQMVTVRPTDPTIALSDKQDPPKEQDSAAKPEPPPAKPVQAAASKVRRAEEAVPVRRRAEEAAPPRRRADRPRRRQTRTWADAQAPDVWNEVEPRAYVRPDGGIVYVYPERRYLERRYLPPGMPGDW